MKKPDTLKSDMLCTAWKVVFAIGIVCGFCHGQESVPNSAYASFLEQVVQTAQANGGAPVLLNGQDTGMLQPSVQQSLGLTDVEFQVLHSLSVAYVAKTRAFDEVASHLILELRLQLIDALESEQPVLRRRLDEIENRRNQIVGPYVEELQLRLGDLRFEVIRAYVQSRKDGIFFPLVPK